MTTPASTEAGEEIPRHACSRCARRKVKCDKGDPCSNCQKSRAPCKYEVSASLAQPRKRAADDDLLARIAQYEDLMRKHNIDFSAHSHKWVRPEPTTQIKEDASAPRDITTGENPIELSNKDNVELKSCAWSSLAPELKRPPFKNLRHSDDPLNHPNPPIQSILSTEQSEPHDLHPEPRHIFRCWQIFVDNVDPLLKIVHIPTLQPRILEAAWDPAKAPKSLSALMFSIYTLTVTSQAQQACLDLFGESRTCLLARYRAATLRALVRAELLTTPELEVLQAFVLFLLADPDSESTAVLSSVAVRLGQMIGIYQDGTDPSVPFFEREMRIRLLWQLHALDSRVFTSYVSGMRPQLPVTSTGTIRLPMNINDVDLHPDMKEPPKDSDKPTEMTPVLIKYEIFYWFRTSPSAMKFYESALKGPVPGKVWMKQENDAIGEIDAIFHQKFLRHFNRDIPLHNLGYIIARVVIANMWFRVHHPRGRAAVQGGEVYMTHTESDALFSSAVTFLEMAEAGKRSRFSSHLFAHIHLNVVPQLDACIYVLSELRYRFYGELVSLAWKLIDSFYEEHPQLINETDNSFFVALGDLSLEAWQAKVEEHSRIQATHDSPIEPGFIRELLGKRSNPQELQLPHASDSYDCGNIGLIDEYTFGLDFWNEILR